MWQRFDDEEAGRAFFYNTLTNEGMYDKPPEWSQLEAAEAAKVNPRSQTAATPYQLRLIAS